MSASLVSGLMLLLRKPIRQGNVVAFEKSFAGARWGWITDIDLMYVTAATRDDVLLLPCQWDRNRLSPEWFTHQRRRTIQYNQRRPQSHSDRFPEGQRR